MHVLRVRLMINFECMCSTFLQNYIGSEQEATQEQGVATRVVITVRAQT
jgi:hypothetical protein